MTSHAQTALKLFDAQGEAVALRYLLDHSASGSAFQMPDGSKATRSKKTRSYEFAWPGGQATRPEQPLSLFPWPDRQSAIHALLLSIESEIAPEDANPRHRGDDPSVSVEEALRLCPELEQSAEREAEVMNPNEALWEIIEELVERMAENLIEEMGNASLEKLTALTARRRTEQGLPCRTVPTGPNSP